MCIHLLREIISGDRYIFNCGALEDISIVSPSSTEWNTFEPSTYSFPSLQNQEISIVSYDCTNPCVKFEPAAMGSLTKYCSSLEKMGIVNPPAECIAAVDPAPVDTLRPLDLEWSRGEGSPSFLILYSRNTNHTQFVCLLKIRKPKHFPFSWPEWESRNCCRTWMSE